MTGNRDRFIAYAVQRFPALRTTFIRREVEALRELGLRIEVVSMRPANSAELVDDQEAQPHLTTTWHLPTNPLGLASIWANMVWALRRPRPTLRNLRLALEDPGQRGWKHRVRLGLQVWRGAVLAQMLRSAGDCAHVHAHFADGAATTALAAARLLGVPFSFTSHTSHRPAALIAKLREARFVASISEYDRRQLRSIGGASVAQKVHVIRCGLPPQQWPFEPRQQLHDPLRIVSVGALIEKKGHDVLIRACSRLIACGRPVECRVVGGGPLRNELQRLIDELGLAESVQLLGPLPQSQIRRQMQWADVFVLACKRTVSGDTDGIPVSLMEAMAMGVPVVSCHISGIPELIADGRTGFLAEPGDADSLARAVLRCVRAFTGDGASEGRELVNRARAQIEAHFNVQSAARYLARLFHCGRNLIASTDAIAAFGAGAGICRG